MTGEAKGVNLTMTVIMVQQEMRRGKVPAVTRNCPNLSSTIAKESKTSGGRGIQIIFVKSVNARTSKRPSSLD